LGIRSTWRVIDIIIMTKGRGSENSLVECAGWRMMVPCEGKDATPMATGLTSLVDTIKKSEGLGAVRDEITPAVQGTKGQVYQQTTDNGLDTLAVRMMRTGKEIDIKNQGHSLCVHSIT